MIYPVPKIQRKRHKYRATKVTVSEGTFPSKLEFTVFKLLKLRELAQEIADIVRYPSVQLRAKCSVCGGKAMNYKVDMCYRDLKTNEVIYVEAKGAEDKTYRRNRAQWKKTGPGKLEVWSGTYLRPFLKEVVEVKK